MTELRSSHLSNQEINSLTPMGLSNKLESKCFSLSFAELNAESHKVKTFVFNILRKSAINLRKSARKKRNLLNTPSECKEMIMAVPQDLIQVLC
jgi:hypothetical protein